MTSASGNSGLVEKEGFGALVLRLRGDGMMDTRLLTAVEETPRTLYTPMAFSGAAYSPRLVPIECGSFMEGADLAVQMIYLLMVKPGQRVLEIGTGSGFMSAVLARLAERVVTLERYRTLVELARQRFEQAGLSNIASRHGDGSRGAPGEGTFDRIVATAAFKDLPRFFVEQLVPGGVVIAPVIAEDETCTLVRLTRVGNRFDREDLFAVPFQPLIPGEAAVL